ncbi:hypothetical protein NAC44_20355 [Allorhizobium sp. BGMRC 0089]|uniref:hypothetical protein n=1 Tax=Allorhizobium sonneratiae TaxID=2934936 RepID=UPI0020347B2A|nr:hypothetical protein [Allorhizobium sonneratiae]MCM2294683.1 hypothetical protein [Allorhizobium sonneratiae]
MKRIDLDLSDLDGERKEKPRLTMDQINQDAADSGFTTRHAERHSNPVVVKAAQSIREPMRRGRKPSTGRNTPFSVKLKMETNNTIYRLAEEMQCNAIAEVIERAIAALERELADK